jgi:hypothetical protein
MISTFAYVTRNRVDRNAPASNNSRDQHESAADMHMKFRAMEPIASRSTDGWRSGRKKAWRHPIEILQ